MANAQATTWGGPGTPTVAREPSIHDWLKSKILWFGIAAVLIFSVEIVLLSTVENRGSEERLLRASTVIAPVAALAVATGSSPELEKTLARFVEAYALSSAAVVGRTANVRAVADHPATASASWVDGLRFMVPHRFMVTSHAVNLMHEGNSVGQLELVSANPGFAALICLMLASMVAAFFGLAWLVSSLGRRVHGALRAPVEAITQLSEQVTVAGNFEYRMVPTDSRETFAFENKVNQFLDVVSGHDKAHLAKARSLNEELAARAHDIAAQSKQLQTLAYISSETRLPNRAALVERVPAMCAETPLPGRSVAIFMCHITKLEHANEAFGFDVGALLVQFAADRLEETTPPFSELFHLGGPDFAVLVDGDTASMERVVDQLRFAEESPFLHGGATLHLKLRIGYALFPDDAASGEELMRFAPLAMSEASNVRSLGATVRFKPVYLLNSLAKESLEDAIRYALDHDLIEPFFQPRVDAASGRVSGFEAFVRW
jgi:diguanylate cyclase (GGDEF)-like protein